MSRVAYCFILIVVGLAIFLSIHEEGERRTDIDRAAEAAIVPAVEEACIQRNALRDRVLGFYLVASKPPRLDRETGRRLLDYEDCPDTAKRALEQYRVARDQ